MNHLKRGVPSQLTKRSRLQDRRCSLNEQLKRELRLKAGAINLLKVTTDPKVRQQVELELSFVESNIQLLKDKFAKLNTTLNPYQSERSNGFLPLVPLGLKETKEILFSEVFKDFILEHYSEDPSVYDEPLRDLDSLRRSVRRPSRDQSGVKLLKSYLIQLGNVEKRFFSYRKPLKIYFEWFDSLTGDPYIQRSIAFEKGAIIFNIAALLTQIAVNQDREDFEGLEKAVRHFSLATGWLSHLKENFSFAPSPDIQPETLDAISSLLLAEAQECVLDKILLEKMCDELNLEMAFLLAEEAAFVGDSYDSANIKLSQIEAVPSTWTQLAQIKRDHFRALAHFWTAKGVFTMTDTSSAVRRLFRHHFTERSDVGKVWDPRQPPQNATERTELTRRHLKLSLQYHEDAISRTEIVAELGHMKKILQLASEDTKLFDMKISPAGFQGFSAPPLEDPAEIFGRSSEKVSSTSPDLSKKNSSDIFWLLGPISIFNAEELLSAPKHIRMRLDEGCYSFGFSVSGGAPVTIDSVDVGGLAERYSIRPGDLIVAVGSVDTKWCKHDEVVKLIRECGSTIDFVIVSTGWYDPSPEYSRSSISSSSMSTPSSSVPMKFRPSYYYANDVSTLPAKHKERDQCQSPSPWTFRSLLSPKKRANSESKLFDP